MNRTTKTVVSSIFAIATIVSASPVFADSPTPDSGIVTPTLDSGIITPFSSSYAYYNTSVQGNTTNPSVTLAPFNIPANYGWVKVWVQNNGLDTITVTVTQGTATGPVKMQFTVAPGQQDYRLASSPWSTGNHVVSISPSSGSPVKAVLSVKLATTQAEL